MEENPAQAFSRKWVIISLVVFTAVEIVLGLVIGQFLFGGYFSYNLHLFLQSLLHLASYFIGGVIIGVISPGGVIFEPAIGAFLSIALMLVISLISPFGLFGFSLLKLLIGGGIAFFLALTGARIGERMTGHRV